MGANVMNNVKEKLNKWHESHACDEALGNSWHEYFVTTASVILISGSRGSEIGYQKIRLCR